MIYTISTNQGWAVFTATGKPDAEIIIRKLIKEGKSYSVETNRHAYVRSESYNVDGTRHANSR